MGCHIIKAPSGRYIFVGSIPHSLCNIRAATTSDILGCRTHQDAIGNLLCASSMVFDSEHEARDFAASVKEEIAN